MKIIWWAVTDISSMALQRSGNANTAKEVVAVIGEVPVPICGSNEYWRVVIGTPAQNSNLTHSTVRPSAPIARRALGTGVPTILDPFIYVAMRVVEVESVWRNLPIGAVKSSSHRLPQPSQLAYLEPTELPHGNVVRVRPGVTADVLPAYTASRGAHCSKPSHRLGRLGSDHNHHCD